jgi:hypothetical protein
LRLTHYSHDCRILGASANNSDARRQPEQFNGLTEELSSAREGFDEV